MPTSNPQTAAATHAGSSPTRGTIVLAERDWRAPQVQAGLTELCGSHWCSLITVAALLAISALCQAGEPPGVRLAQIGFEASEGYVAGQPLIGQQGWRRGGWSGQLATGGNGVGMGLMTGSLQQAFIGGIPGTTSAPPTVWIGIDRTFIYQPAPGFGSTRTSVALMAPRGLSSSSI